MPYEKYSLSDLILENLFNIRGLLSRPYKAAYLVALKQREVSSREFGQAVHRMRSRKLIEVTERNNQKFIRLTKEGQLRVLLEKAEIVRQKKWDGKWRLFMFDIPEASKVQRNFLRNLLKKNNFSKLQASVYINPYPLNREAIQYLRQTGLYEYIRILKVEEIDDSSDLLRKFNLKE